MAYPNINKPNAMTKKIIDNVDLLLSKLDRTQLEDFIRKECTADGKFQEKFLKLGTKILFNPNPKSYAERVADLIEDYSEKYGYIVYRDTFDFNRAVTQILDEADDAIENGYWETAMAIFAGVSSEAENIINSGDDSAGELSAIIYHCFEKWHKLCTNDSLPGNIRSEIFEYALSRFNDNYLKGWDWWWNWMEMAIILADTPDKQKRVIAALDVIRPEGDDWSAQHDAETAQIYRLKMMSKCGTEEDQIKFMYDNVSNPDFRNILLQKAWDKSDYDEVLRLAKDGVIHDAEYAGLLKDWHKWEYKVYRQTKNRQKELELARYFFFNEGGWGEKEYYFDAMYAVLKSLVPQDEWMEYVKTLIREACDKKDTVLLLYIYAQEKMWKEYMDFLRKDPSTYNIDDAPEELKKLFADEIVKLYASAVNGYFQQAYGREAYREGVALLRRLIKYGGTKEADQIVAEQKSRRPPRPALIDELSKLNYQNPMVVL